MANRQRTDFIVFHCSATKPSQHIGKEQIEEWHLSRGFSSIGYHFVITRAGDLQLGRPLEEIGAHVQGFNANSVGICMVGGLDERGLELVNAPQMFTPDQWATAHDLVAMLRHVYPSAKIKGHRDFSPDTNKDGRIEQREWLKTCPGFDAAQQFPV